MILKHPSFYGTIACLTLLSTLGCLTRTEAIRIARDGTATIAVNYEGSPDDFETADALPSTTGGWNTVIVSKKKDDEETRVLTAERTFAPGEDLPRSYASDNEPEDDLCLQFPTTLRVEERPDGVYYYFHRVYTPRRWRYVQYWKDEFIDDDIEKLGEKPAEEMTLADKFHMARAFVSVEACKQVEFAKTARDESAPDLSPVNWLLARQALLDTYAKEDLMNFNDIFKRCEQMPEDQTAECFDSEAERILAAGYAALVQSLRENAGLDAAQLAAFDHAYERAEMDYQITDELGAHSFLITVELPGTLIAQNGEIEEKDGKRVAGWAFDGNAFRDRPYELLAVSRVANTPETDPEDAVDDTGR